MKEKRWTVYCHIHRESGRRYVGLTSKTMLARWNDHVYKAKSAKGGRWHFPNAIRKYGKDAFSHEVLEVCSSLEEANERESFWIWTYDTRNPLRGFNLALGGKHVPHPIRKNPWDNPEFRKANLPGAVARINTPQARIASARAMKQPKTKAKKSAASRALWQDPEYRGKTVTAVKEKWQDPEYREKRSEISREVMSRSEAREKSAAASRRANSDPGYLRRKSEATRASWKDPEVRARRSAASKASNARQNVKAKISAGVKAARARREAEPVR